MRDRVALFVNAAANREVSPQAVSAPASSSDTTSGGVTYQSLVRFRDLLRSYGVEPGSFSSGTYSTPSRNLFVKVTAQLGLNSRLAVSHNYGHGNDRREIGERDDPGFYALSSSGTQSPETINATRLAWTTAFGGRFSNQLVLARVDDRRTCLPSSDFPGVSLTQDGPELFAGGATTCLGLETGHTLWEITDNFGMAAGNHRLTFGTHGERIDLVDDVLDVPGGLWTFGSLDSLAQGKAASYLRDFPTVADSQVAFRVNQIGVYAQDQWLPTPHLTVTAGLRLDVPFVPTPPARNATACERARHQYVADAERERALVSAARRELRSLRAGHDRVAGRGGILRGPSRLRVVQERLRDHRYPRDSGSTARAMPCRPSRSTRRTNPPACAEPSPLAFPLAYFDPDFRFPRTLKVALGVDRPPAWGIVGTVDLLYTRLREHGRHGRT